MNRPVTVRGACLSAMLASLLTATAAQAQEGVKYVKEKERIEPVLTLAPTVSRFVEATYPEQALDDGLDADVRLQIDLDAEGRVTEVTVLEPVGSGFDEAAVEAVRAFGFTPAEVDGQPAPVRLEYVYHFRLQQVQVGTEPDGTAPGPGENFKGQVRELGTNLPVVGAAISVEGMDGEALTDGKGLFSLSDVATGVHAVKVLAPDFKPLTTEVEIKEDMVVDVVFRLELLAESPYMTVVRGEREKDVVARYTLSKRELTTVPGTFGDPARVVQNLPGVARSPYTSGFLLVRGSFPMDSSVFLDGVRIPLLYHFMGGPSVLNPEFLERIDFYPGNFGVKYGRTGGGIVEVETSSKKPEIWNGILDVNLFFASGFAEVPLTEDITLKLGLRRSYYDLIVPLFMKAAGYGGSVAVPVYYDYQGRLDMALDNDDHAYIMFLGSDDQFSLATGDEDSTDGFNFGTHQGFHRITAKHLWHITPDLTSTFVPHAGYDIQVFDIGQGNIDFTTWSAGFKEDLSWRVLPQLELRPGLDFQWMRSTYKAFFPAIQNYIVPGQNLTQPVFGPPTTFDPTGAKKEISHTIQGFSLGLYLEAVWQPVKRLKLIPGIRFDAYFYMGRQRFSGDPRLNIRLDVGGGVTLKAGAGLYHQLPSEYMLDPEYGNPDLQLEWSEQYSLGLEWRFAKVWKLDLQGYYVRWHDRAIPTSEGTMEDGVFFNEIYSNAGWGRSYGMEFLLRHDVTDFFYGWVAYTLSRSETIPREGWPLAPSLFDQTHILTLVASFNVGRGWEIGTRFRLVSGNPRTPVENSTFVGYNGGYNPLTGDTYSDRNKLFHQLDLRIEKTWKLKYGTFSLYLDVQNIYYQKNVEFTVYDYRYRDRYEIPGLTLLPTLGMKGRF